MLQVEKVSVRYGDVQPLREVTFALDHGCMAITGPSGSGKSTLLRVIAGLQRPDSGQVTIAGEPVATPARGASGDRRVGLIHQDYRLVPFLSVQENLELAAEVRGIGLESHAVPEVLERVGLATGFAARRPSTLSGGEQQRLAIARLLVCGVRVVVADEPTGALDGDNTRRIAELFAEVASVPGVVVVVATHDPVVAASIERGYELRDGALCPR